MGIVVRTDRGQSRQMAGRQSYRSYAQSAMTAGLPALRILNLEPADARTAGELRDEYGRVYDPVYDELMSSCSDRAVLGLAANQWAGSAKLEYLA